MTIKKLYEKAGVTNIIVNTVRMQRPELNGHSCRLPNEGLVKRIMKKDFEKRPKGRLRKDEAIKSEKPQNSISQ